MGLPVFPDAKGFRRLTAPGFKPPSGWRPGRLRFRPQSGLIQRGVCIPPAAAVVGALSAAVPLWWLAPPPFS